MTSLLPVLVFAGIVLLTFTLTYFFTAWDRLKGKPVNRLCLLVIGSAICFVIVLLCSFFIDQFWRM